VSGSWEKPQITQLARGRSTHAPAAADVPDETPVPAPALPPDEPAAEAPAPWLVLPSDHDGGLQ